LYFTRHTNFAGSDYPGLCWNFPWQKGHDNCTHMPLYNLAFEHLFTSIGTILISLSELLTFGGLTKNLSQPCFYPLCANYFK